MTAKYTNPLTGYTTGQLGKPARLGLGYDEPTPIDARIVYQAEICLRISGYWVTLNFTRITNEQHLAILEDWYQSNQADE
jgi:hypothetical protein